MDEQKNEQKNIDLSDIPDNFAKKPEEEQEKFQEPGLVLTPETPTLVKWLIKHSGGKIKSVKIANYILLVFAVVIFVISLFLFYIQLAPKNFTAPAPYPEFVNDMESYMEP